MVNQVSIIIIALRIVYRVTIKETLGLAVNEVPRSLCIYTVTLFWSFRFSFGYLQTFFLHLQSQQHNVFQPPSSLTSASVILFSKLLAYLYLCLY